MFEISKDFSWSASHHLNGLPCEHQCSRVHGHNYIARIHVVARDLDEHGFVLDYGELAEVGRFIDAEWDHQDMNAWLEGDLAQSFPWGDHDQPSGEVLAAILCEVTTSQLVGRGLLRDGMAVSVSVSETPKSWARFTPPEWQKVVGA